MRTFPSTLLATGALALAFGCAPSNPGLVAEGVLSADTMCVVTATNAYILEGTLDLQYTGLEAYRSRGISYIAAFQVGNALINNANRAFPLMADPNRIVISNAEVTLLDGGEQTLSLAGLPNPYLVPADGAIASTESMDPTLGIAAATIITDAYGQALAQRYTSGGSIVARVRIIGQTAGGATLTTGPVVFPIHLCVGCLFRGACDSMHNPITSLSCLPGQDAVSQVPGC